jgi:hypothetical protein
MPDIARYYEDSISVESSSFATNRRFNIVLCELHNPAIHGFDKNSDPEVAGHYLIHSKYDTIICDGVLYDYDSDNSDNSDNDETSDNIYNVIHNYKMHIEYNIIPSTHRTRHPFIRNYKAIVSNENYIKPEIAECLYLSGEECIAILKTFWLRLVQRAWKRVFAERKQIYARRMRPDSLRHREIHGKWPLSCNRLPSLHGMLYQKPKVL